MIDTCPICPDSSAHKLGAYLQEFDSLFPSDHRSADDKLNYRSDGFTRKHATAPRNERQTRVLDQKRWSWTHHADTRCVQYIIQRTSQPCSWCALE
jgi:hypothetical protein